MVGTLELRFRICPLSPHQVMVGTLESRIRRIHLYLSQQIGVRSSKTSQCSSANRPSVVPQGHQGFWCLSKSLLVSQIAVSVCRHDLPPCTTRWPTLLGVTIRWLEASPWSLYFPPLTGTLHTGSNMTSACMIRVGRINFHIPDSLPTGSRIL